MVLCIQVREAAHHRAERLVAQDAGGAQERVQEAAAGEAVGQAPGALPVVS